MQIYIPSGYSNLTLVQGSGYIIPHDWFSPSQYNALIASSNKTVMLNNKAEAYQTQSLPIWSIILKSK